MIRHQYELKKTNHPYSEKSKAPHGLAPPVGNIEVGDLVYVRSDRSKTHPRDRYLVATTDGDWCNIRKFAGSQIQNLSYRVKKSDFFKVPVAG